MRKFNRGYALIFLVFIILAVGAVWYSYQRVEGVFQSQTAQYAEYTVDDWLELLRLDEVLVGLITLQPIQSTAASFLQMSDRVAGADHTALTNPLQGINQHLHEFRLVGHVPVVTHDLLHEVGMKGAIPPRYYL